MATNPRHVKLRKDLIDAFSTRMDNLDRQIESQKTSKSGSVFIRSGEINEDGSPKGTGTLIGSGADSGGIAPWVNDTTAPGRPTGAVVDSGNGMILLRWDGTLEGGVPDDFDHISWIVDGVERGRLAAKGVAVVGPLDVGSVHEVFAVAYDNAHDQEGKPTPNRSEPTPTVSVTVSGADIDPEVLGITVTKTDKSPDVSGQHTGDLWLQYGSDAKGKTALAASWWWNGSEWVQLPVAIYLDQLAARNVKIDDAVIGMLSAGIVQSATFTTPDGLTGFDTDGFWVKDGSGKKAFRANANGVLMNGIFQTANNSQARIVISKKVAQGPGGSSDKRTLNNIDFYPERDPSRIAASIALWDSGAVTTLTLGDDNATTSEKSSHTGTIALSGTGNLKDRSIDAEAEEINIGKPLDSTIAVVSKENNVAAAGDISIEAARNLNLNCSNTAVVHSGANDINSFKTTQDHIEANGNLWLNGRAVTGQSRRIVEWISDWTGTPVHAEGTTKWEYETDISLRNSPTGGQWLVAELGARVIANNGEYFMTISITGGDGNEYFLYSLSSTKSPGTDNFATSKLFMLPNGSYHVKLGFTRWGNPGIGGDARFAFKDWTPGRGIKTGFRYFTLTELN